MYVIVTTKRNTAIVAHKNTDFICVVDCFVGNEVQN